MVHHAIELLFSYVFGQDLEVLVTGVFVFGKGKRYGNHQGKTNNYHEGSFHKALKFPMKLYKNPALTFTQQLRAA